MVKPVQIQVPLRVVPIEVCNIAVAIQILPHGTNMQDAIHTTAP